MPEPRRHHYVPQFYLRRFVDSEGRIWVWDKGTDRTFPSTPTSIAVETDFYKIHEFVEAGHDPYLMEKQLAGIDGEMSLITKQWVEWLRQIKPNEKIEIPTANRQIVSRFLSLQHLRTADTKDTLCALHEQTHPGKPFPYDEKARLHTDMLWNLSTVDQIADYIEKAVWIFAQNSTKVPLVTSDNPITFRANDNKMWLKVGFIGGAYAAYPLAPDLIMFCHGGDYWKSLQNFDRSLSPVLLNEEMVESENTGQVFMASRFLISPVNDFHDAREFAATIGTDRYAPSEGDQ